MRREREMDVLGGSRQDVWEAPGAEEFDALADLFLEPAAAREAPRAARVELVSLGHLPSVAGVWAGQYARRAAELSGRPVALARLRDDGVTVELFGAGGVALAPARSAERAIGAAVRAGADLLLCVQEREESELLGSGRISALNLLTGADQASLVGAYRKLKALLGRLRDEDRPAVRIAVVGAPAEKSDGAFARLARSAESFLSARVERLEPIERIEPARAALLHRGAAPLDPTRLIEAALRAPVEHAADDGAGEEPGAPERAAAAPTNGRPEARGEACGERASVPDLEWLALPCPDAPGVSLAIDMEGRLHLIARGEAAQGAMGLASAKAWAMRHGPLLEAACASVAQRRLRVDLEPAMTLLTDDARAVRALLDTPVRVRLLPSGDGVAAPLN